MAVELAPNDVVAGADVEIDLDPLPVDEVVDGAPETGVQVVGRLGGVEVGVWEMTPGTCRDVEADEFFVVLSGRADVDFEDGGRLELRPGDIVRLTSGTKTVWTVQETLRKVYLTESL